MRETIDPTNVELINSPDHAPTGAEFVFLDTEAFGGFEGVALWSSKHSASLSASGRIVIGFIGAVNGDATLLMSAIDGIAQRPASSDLQAWIDAARPVITAIKHPEFVDVLPREGTVGNVSMEEFTESMRRASRGEGDEG